MPVTDSLMNVKFNTSSSSITDAKLENCTKYIPTRLVSVSLVNVKFYSSSIYIMEVKLENSTRYFYLTCGCFLDER